ncbi:AUGMIN subunit 4 [Alnus glutinosa]|uniref:AUGMIN subunit 4 n=1 Tax=Alnus glutinosa TaxID=3517 RepID=UPI002D76B5B1|nr:AUGMIN subunit 4 [Alnus glutinosa]
MVKGLVLQGGQTLPADVAQVIDQLERHCFAPDGSLVPKPAFYDLQLAREEMSRERLRYLEAMAVYCEAIAMVEEYQQAVSVRGDVQGLYPQQLGLNNSPQVYKTLEHRMVIAEAAQKLRLPLISKDGEVQEDDIEKLSIMSRSSLDSTSTSATMSSSSSSTNYTTANSTTSVANNAVSAGDVGEPGVGGVPNRFLGITPAYLWQTQLQQLPFSMDMADYQMSLSREIEARLKDKCDKLGDAFIMDDIDSSSGHQSSSARLPERVKLIIEEIEREEAALREDLYSADRKFAEYYNVLEQILGVLIKLVKDLKLQHQHKYDELQKTWLCKRCETMSAKLRVLEHVLLLETYTQESIPALHKIRKYLLEATEEASIAYNKAVTRLREYQGVDPHFDTIARQYHDIVKKLENMQWTIHQVEMDLKRLPDQQTS